ncbi:MAG: DUF4405 domain-containing protein [Anaerolineaceae bacterium]|nr:MAG: DUF4405 domain-containing protein [Anaerolineaceae bacterium]
MNKTIRMSRQTRQNWLIDAAVFAGALLSGLSGIYFLYLPSGGYEGGRNPAYGLTILFGRQTWSDIHTWGGVLMIVAVVVHFAIHWQWVKMMSRRIWHTMRGKGANFSKGAKVNLVIDLIIGAGFLITAVSGIYFLFLPQGYQGGRNPGWDPGLLFSRTTWDLIHTWAAVFMILAASLHLFIHWRWVVNVTRRFFLSLRNQPVTSRITHPTV